MVTPYKRLTSWFIAIHLIFSCSRVSGECLYHAEGLKLPWLICPQPQPQGKQCQRQPIFQNSVFYLRLVGGIIEVGVGVAIEVGRNSYEK